MLRVTVGVLVCFLACRGPEPVGPHAAPATDDIVRKSHAILEAIDKGDLAATTAALDATFVRFDESVSDRAKVLDEVAHWKADGSHVGSRTWSDEHVSARATDAMFLGKAKEHQAGNDVHGGYEFEGWYALGWSRDTATGAWQLVYLSWQLAGAASQATTWNFIFKKSTGFEHAPNKLLATYAAQHAPGTAVDVAMGQGRNAVFLAGAGWKVTGVDIADEGVRQAREAAAAKHVELDAVVADVSTFDYGTERWDLVAMIYAWPAIKKIPDLQRATRSRGLFVYEFFAPVAADDLGPKAGELAKQFSSGWTILQDEIVDDVPDWAADRAKIQRFVARKK